MSSVLSLLTLASLGLASPQGERESLGEDEQEQAEATPEPLLHVVTEEIELAELLDGLARMRGIPIDFDRGRLGKRVTIRSREGLSPESLWASANRLLQAEGLACVQAAGEEGLSVVSLESASALARVERADLLGAAAGYVRTLVELGSEDAEKIGSSVQRAFEKGGLKVEALPDTGHLLLAGLLPSVEEALRLVRVLDRVPGAVVIEEIRVVHVSALHLATLLEQLVQKQKAIDKDVFLGSAIARPSSGSLFVVASEEEMPAWRDMMARLDVEEGLDTRWYVPRRFGLAETAKLLQNLLGSPEAGEGPHITPDDLSGSLVITATPSQHAAVEEVFRRLEETDSPSRRVLRSFPVRHRDVEELLEMLSALVEAGAALPEITGEPDAGTEEVPTPLIQGPTAEIATAAPASSGPTVLREAQGSSLSLSADPGSSRILAFGEPRLLSEVESLLRTLDVPRPQVLVEALVVTLSETEVRQLGVELRKSGTADGALYELGSIFGLGAPSTAAGGIPAPTGTGFSGVVLDPGSFSALLRALETQSRGRTLSVPKVLVENHGVATLDSVLQSPYLATSATTTVATTSFGGSTEAGTQISITPHIGEGDRLRLEYSVSVSSFVGAPADPGLPPPRQENKLEASASLPDGYAVVVGGLEVDGESERESRVPLLGRLPLVGWLFRESSESSTKSRLYVFLRASILRSQSFEDLRWASERPLRDADVESGWPTMRPRIIR